MWYGLRSWTHRNFRLVLVSGLILAAGLHLAATPSQSVPATIRAQQLEVVNTDGAIVFSVRATEAGGRLEVRDHAGVTIFSAGTEPGDSKRAGLWERSQQEFASLRRDLGRHRRDLYAITTRLQELERQKPPFSSATRRGHELDQYRNALQRQERDIDNLERQISRLSRQLNSLERR